MKKTLKLYSFVPAVNNSVKNLKMSSISPAVGAMPSGDIPFGKAKLGSFLQEKPVLHNPYSTDGPLKRYLKRLIPKHIFDEIDVDLRLFGDRIVDEIDELGQDCERNPPTLRPFDAWGRRVDRLVTSSAWQRMKSISAEEGLVASGYENRYGEYGRLYQYVKLYLYAPSSGLYGCPLAMTDGAAKVLKEVMTTAGHRQEAAMLKDAYDRLTTRDPAKFWTSGQWMTEKRGGSDVANGTETVAYLRGDGNYDLYGYKWFSSATDADMTLTLARPVSTSKDSPVSGTKGLSLFFVKVRDDSSGDLNNIEIVRLKDKLGTRQLPTAELLLDGTVAHKLSADGRGVASIAHMLNITRLHNAASAVSAMRRSIALSRDYMHRRKVFGKLLVEHPLHVQTLARLELESRGNLVLFLEVVNLLGLQETKKINENQTLLLRLLVPLLKLYSGKMVVPFISEILESFGGMGYLEDTGLPVALRDAQVLPIWEGTTNVLSMDVLRHLAKEGQAVLTAYQTDITERTKTALSSVALTKSAKIILDSSEQVLTFAVQNGQLLELAARDFAMSLTRCYIGALLLEHAVCSEATDDDVITAVRWCQAGHVILLKDEHSYSRDASQLDAALLLDEYPNLEKAKL